MTIAIQPIYTQTASGSSSTIVFNNIPQTFTDLKLVISARLTDAGNFGSMYLRFNGNSSALYSTTYAMGYGGVYSGRSSNAGAIETFYSSASGATANTYSSNEIYLPNYTSSNFKQVNIDSVQENNHASESVNTLDAGLFRSTSAVTSLTIISGVFTSASTFTLYGITKG